MIPMHRDLASQPYSPLIPVMTADYLLTAKDLPGWRGEFPPINYRNVLKKGLQALRHGFYREDRIIRELNILEKIAEKHGLDNYFRTIVRKSRRYKKRDAFMGNGTNGKSFFLDGRQLGLHNIFDAAYAVKYIYQGYSFINLSTVASSIVNSITYRIRSLSKGDHFPPESEWK